MPIQIGAAFKDNLAQLPNCDNVARVTLRKKNSGADAGTIENKPGTSGSVKLYCYLLGIFGGEITRQAAHLGCAIFAEHLEDAYQHPGSHANIDRLLEVIATGETLTSEIVMI